MMAVFMAATHNINFSIIFHLFIAWVQVNNSYFTFQFSIKFSNFMAVRRFTRSRWSNHQLSIQWISDLAALGHICKHFSLKYFTGFARDMEKKSLHSMFVAYVKRLSVNSHHSPKGLFQLKL